MEKTVMIAAFIGGFMGLVLFLTILDIDVKLGAIKGLLEKATKQSDDKKQANK